MKTIHGKVHGRTIQVDEDLGLSDGQDVELQVRVIPTPPLRAGEGLLRTEGALAEDTEWDSIMEEIHQDRRTDRRSQVPDLEVP